jgi:hypothetical protein
MIPEVAGPGLEHGQQADLGPELFVVAGDVPQAWAASPPAAKAMLVRG